MALNTQSPYTTSLFPLCSGCSKILLLHFHCFPAVPMFRTYKYLFCFPFRGQNNRIKTSLACTHKNQIPAATTIFAFYESSKYFKDKILSKKFELRKSILIAFDSNSLHYQILVPRCRSSDKGKIARSRHAIHHAGFVQLILMVAEKRPVCRSKPLWSITP